MGSCPEPDARLVGDVSGDIGTGVDGRVVLVCCWAVVGALLGWDRGRRADRARAARALWGGGGALGGWGAGCAALGPSVLDGPVLAVLPCGDGAPGPAPTKHTI